MVQVFAGRLVAVKVRTTKGLIAHYELTDYMTLCEFETQQFLTRNWDVTLKFWTSKNFLQCSIIIVIVYKTFR